MKGSIKNLPEILQDHMLSFETLVVSLSQVCG